MLQLDVAGRPPGRGAKCCRPTLARLHGRIRNGASSGVPCARSLVCSDAAPGWRARTGGRGRERGRPAVGRAVHGCPRPAAARLHAASRRAPRAKRMNQPRPPFPVLSLKSAGGRAQRRSMLAFREHSPSRPSRPGGAVWLPPSTPYERIPNCSRLPVSPALPPPPPPPPCRGIAPLGSRRRCFEAQPGGRRGRTRACVRRFCGTGLHQGGGKPGVERPSPSTRGPRGAQAGLAGPQRAGACGQPSAHLTRGDPGSAHGGVPGPSVPAQPARPGRPGRKQGDLGQSLPFLQDEV